MDDNEVADFGLVLLAFWGDVLSLLLSFIEDEDDMEEEADSESDLLQSISELDRSS
jgi:hypothetical protein